MIFEVQSGNQTYEVDAPDQNTAIQSLHGLMAKVKPPAGPDFSEANPANPATEPPGMRAGVDQAAAAAAPTVGGDIARSTGSRLTAGALDIPGTLGDLGSLADSAGSAAAQGIMSLFGVSPEKRQQAHATADTLAGNAGIPGSEDVKKAIGFQAYQPQTGAGKVFDKYVGTGLEIAPSLALGGGGAAKKVAGDVLKYAIAPGAAGEIAGDVTKGTPLEPFARVGAMVATGGAAGAKRATSSGALSVDEWRALGDKAYKDMKTAGVAVKPTAFDRMVNGAEQQLHVGGYRPALHPPVKTVLDEMKAAKGVPQSFQELDQLHRLAMGQTKSLDADTRRVAGMLADKIDSFMENLKPGDLWGPGDPKVAFNALMSGRNAWRSMRNGERIDNIIAKAKDAAGANYTAAGLQTALKQQFRGFKWTGKAQLRPEYKRLSSEEKLLVDSIIKGGNALRLIGKFNWRNPIVAGLMGVIGATGSPFLAGATLAAGEAARHISARGTLAKVNRLGESLRGGKVTPGSWGRPPNAVFYGTAAQRASDQSK